MSRVQSRSSGRGSQVDESLFGGRAKTTASKKEPKVATSKVQTEAVILSAADLDRLKMTAAFTAHEVQEHRDRALHETRAQREMIAAARKERMLVLEEARKKAEPMSDLQIEAQQKQGNILSRAQKAIDERKDDVKQMNSLMLYAKCATIRELQVDEKARMKEEEKAAERLAEEMMEVERRKAIQLYEDREKRSAEERLKGAAVIRQQIEMRERERMREQELKDQEGEALLRQLEQMKLEEQRQHHAKIEQQKKLREVVMKANQEQIMRKAELSQAEREEEQRIQEYIREKERREGEHAAELERIAIAKERETARMRAMQEKASDKQAERDMTRAKRAQEAHERQWREQELAAVRKREAINSDLAEARERQRIEQELRLAQAARAEKEDFDRVIKLQKSLDEQEREKVHADEMRRRMHSDEVRRQIAEKENERRQARQESFEEGRRIREEMERERARLEEVKARKIQEMSATGVPQKFLSQLAQKQMLSAKTKL